MDAINVLGQTPLHVAVRDNNLDAIRALLLHGADMHRADLVRVQLLKHSALK